MYVSTTIAALAGVVQRSLNFEFPDHIRVGQRNIGCLGHVVVRRADAFDQVIVVILPLPIHDDPNVAAPQLRGSVQFALRAGRKRKELVEILSSQGKRTNGVGLNSLTGSRSGSVYRLNYRLHFNLL